MGRAFVRTWSIVETASRTSGLASLAVFCNAGMAGEALVPMKIIKSAAFLRTSGRALLRAAMFPLIIAIVAEVRANGYDPLAVEAGWRPSPLDLTVHDAGCDRDIPLRVYLPTNIAPAPVILFSHGLGGSRTGSAFLGQHWAGRGYAAVCCTMRNIRSSPTARCRVTASRATRIIIG